VAQAILPAFAVAGIVDAGFFRERAFAARSTGFELSLV
jgi:hypothetical protein